MLNEKRIAVIGAGNMAETLIRGMTQNQLIEPGNIIVTDVLAERRDLMVERYGVRSGDSTSILLDAEVIILAVKPHKIEEVLSAACDHFIPSQLLISIAAGITVSQIGEALGPENRLPVVRVMPNAPASVLSGASAIYAGAFTETKDVEIARAIFESVGKVVILDREELMDAVTGLSGSGPAYVFTMIEALSDAGLQLGLPRPLANTLAIQTVYGAAKMALAADEPMSKLRDLVTTPGGTTAAGLRAMEEGKFRATVSSAVEAAAARSRELAKK
ncbi:pyrroline-5-carboxylate reductase [bacterium]|nr:pyrroline-5-carboxylate reductase [bacterium]MCB9475596.1 pyrroline-5-carboxylate reductase [Deltaproteobacteria bacterium]